MVPVTTAHQATASEKAADRHINIVNIGHCNCARSRQVVIQTLVV